MTDNRNYPTGAPHYGTPGPNPYGNVGPDRGWSNPGPPPGPRPVTMTPSGSGRGRKFLIGVMVFVAFVFGVLVGNAGDSSSGSAEGAPAEGPAVASSSAATTPAKSVASGPKTSFGDGNWLVGRDIAAGRYKTEKEANGTCYWERTDPDKTGIGAIIENEIVDGGFPTVTLKAGEEFRSSDCGRWVKA